MANTTKKSGNLRNDTTAARIAYAQKLAAVRAAKVQANIKAVQQAVQQAQKNLDTFENQKASLAKLQQQNETSPKVSTLKSDPIKISAAKPSLNLIESGFFNQLTKFFRNIFQTLNPVEKQSLKPMQPRPSSTIAAKKLAEPALSSESMLKIDALNQSLGRVGFNTAENINFTAAEKWVDFKDRQRTMAVAKAPNVAGFVKPVVPIAVSTPDELRARIINVKSPSVPTHTPKPTSTTASKNIAQQDKSAKSNSGAQQLFSVVTSGMSLQQKSDYIQGMQRALKVQNAPSPSNSDTAPKSPRGR